MQTIWLWIMAVMMPCAALAVSTVPPERHSAYTMDYKGRERSYILYEPSVVWATPLVIVLHGGGGDAAQIEKMTGFTEKAKLEKFAVLYPNGSGGETDKRHTWNVEHCCAYAMRHNTDDVGYISALIEKVLANNKFIDRERVFVTGFSNGGMMAHRVGYELSDKVSAIAPVMAGMFGDESAPTHPVAMMSINGAQDRSIPLKGGVTAGKFARAWDGTPLKPVNYQGTFWAEANGCKTKPQNGKKHKAIVALDYACPNDLKVQQIIVRNTGHAWPGGQKGSRISDEPTQALNATNVIWDFLKDYRPMKRKPLKKK
jgi:polyhydroxybutyrate depolymerase